MNWTELGENACNHGEECYVIEIDVDSQKKAKRFLASSSIYMAQKIRSSEVVYRTLSAEDKELFDEAKAREINDFLSKKATDRCEKYEAEQAGRENRVIRARWVLSWKAIPDDQHPETREKRNQEGAGNTTIARDGSRKAKARIVLLGFQHPDLLQIKTSSPVQSLVARSSLLAMTAWRRWTLESCDATTAFLQAEQTQGQGVDNLYARGVPELARALGNEKNNEVVKVLKAVYGLSNAPRNFWADVHQKIKSIGGVPLVGDPCTWAWLNNQWEVIGAAGCHVDDFLLSGGHDDPDWQKVRQKIKETYQWGAWTMGSIRFAGVQIEQRADHSIIVHQDFYLAEITDVPIDRSRMSNKTATLDERDVAILKSKLGELQWAGVQTNLLITARVGILQSQAKPGASMEVAREVQQVINDLRKEKATQLTYPTHPHIKTFDEWIVVIFGDAGWNNRGNGKSTGGAFITTCSKEVRNGETTMMSPVAWKSWQLTRVARSSNEAEVQSFTEAEDLGYRFRLFWGQLGGYGLDPEKDPKERAAEATRAVRATMVVDSKGGFDAVVENESANLGMSSSRTAVEALALKEITQDEPVELAWVSGDWNLADNFTKPKRECREGMRSFLLNHHWRIRYDPEFIVAEKKQPIKATTLMRRALADESYDDSDLANKLEKNMD